MTATPNRQQFLRPVFLLCMMCALLLPLPLHAQDKAETAILQIRFEVPRRYRRKLKRNLKAETTIAGAISERRDRSRIIAVYSLTPGEGEQTDTILRYEELAMHTDPTDDKVAELIVTPEKFRMERGGKTLRTSPLRNSPYEGMKGWKALLDYDDATGSLNTAAKLDEHAFFGDFYRNISTDFVFVPKTSSTEENVAGISMGDTWKAVAPLFIVDPADKVQQLDCNLDMKYRFAEIVPLGKNRRAARIVFEGKYKIAEAEQPRLHDNAETLVFTTISQTVSGEALLEIAIEGGEESASVGTIIKAEIKIELDLEYTKTADGEAEPYTTIHRHGTMSLQQVALEQ